MTLDPSATYLVKLARPVKLGPFTHGPLNEIEMDGATLARIIEQEGEEAVDYARPL
ncbi:hypothetical protein [Rhizobium straminoryzae]|uniref:hypothetical protein n=1 Tax=Rhizobium straminoryzae TaxID=1387186 RepID=UPI00163DDC70|nr:hypothetical protein [Rhizobium straminoryzae]